MATYRTGSTDLRRTRVCGALAACCTLLAGCVSTVPTIIATPAPPDPPAAALSSQVAMAAPPATFAAAPQSAQSDPAQRACADLASGRVTQPLRATPTAPPSPPEEAVAAEVPDPAGSGPAAPAKPADLGQRIAARAAELKTASAGDAEAAKAAESGRTARAAALYAEAWKASPADWEAAFKAVRLWARIGDFLQAEILIKGIEDKAGATQREDIAQQAQALDKELSVLAGATNEAQRLWRRTFSLEPEGRYAEAVVLLRRLQSFEPTAPGYYVREASFFARCEDVKGAAGAIARGSAAGVSYAGRWSPARDPALVRLWSKPDFVAAIRDTLGDAGVEDFEEHLTAR